MKQFFITVCCIVISLIAEAQSVTAFADSIRIAYKIPEIAFAVISSDSVYEAHTIGFQRINSSFKANPNDRFHIGSNTKAITAFIAALLVKQGNIKWTTKFLDLFPELRSLAKKTYLSITLKDLLTFRAGLPAYTYTFTKPTAAEITGDNARQRYLLAKYFLAKPVMKRQNGLTPSNADYILAGLMLEKATGKSYKELVIDFGKKEGIDFGFDYPNVNDTLQPWGHDTALRPQPPFDNYKLNWLLSAGNINVSLNGYIKFIQLQLKGLKAQSKLLPANTYHELMFGLPGFSYGWFNKVDSVTKHHIAFNEGNAGAFITQAEIIEEAGRAYIVFTNAATDNTKNGLIILLNYLQNKYGK